MCSQVYPLYMDLVCCPPFRHVARGEPGPYMWELGVVERHGGLYISRGSTRYDIENKDALVPYLGVHYLNWILLCALLRLRLVVFVGYVSGYDPRSILN